MAEPTITCPSCKTEIKLNESLAAPLIADATRGFEEKLAAKILEIAKREASLRDDQAAVARARSELDEQLAARVADERERITAEETAKARRASALELKERDKALAEANTLIREREGKLAEAQAEQAHSFA